MYDGMDCRLLGGGGGGGRVPSSISGPETLPSGLNNIERSYLKRNCARGLFLFPFLTLSAAAKHLLDRDVLSSQWDLLLHLHRYKA